MAIDCIPEGIVSQRRSRFEHRNRPPKPTVGSTIAAQAQRLCKLLSLEGIQENELPVGSGVGAITRTFQRRPYNPATPRGLVFQRQDAQGGQGSAIAPCWVDTPRNMQQNGQDTKREIWVEESEAGRSPQLNLDAKSLARNLPWIALEEEELSDSGSVRSACRTNASFTSPLMAPRRVPRSQCALADQRAAQFPVSAAATFLRSSSASRVTSSSPLSTASTFKDEPFTARASASTSAGEAVMNFTETLRENLCTVFQNPDLCGPESGKRKKRFSTGEFVVAERSSHGPKCCSRPAYIDGDHDLEKLDTIAETLGKASTWRSREVPVDSIMSRRNSRRGGA